MTNPWTPYKSFWDEEKGRNPWWPHLGGVWKDQWRGRKRNLDAVLGSPGGGGQGDTPTVLMDSGKREEPVVATSQ